MKNFSLIVFFVMLTVGLKAQDAALWMRYSAISPDGENIAFSYKGDIYKVSAKGGQAIQLTTHPAHDTQPIWSPNSKIIAFASNRDSNFDIFIMSANGGEPKRLTSHTNNEYPSVFKDDSTLLYQTSIIQDVNDGEFPSATFPQIYEVSTKGGRSSLFSSLPMENISFDKTGTKILYHDKKGYEDPWRKHHESSITRDIWMCKLGNERTYTKLTTFKGENRNPVWTADGTSHYYLSERDGSFNIYKQDIAAKTPKQLTKFKDHPIRFLTSSEQETLCFSYNGEIYTMENGAEPKKVDIHISTDNQENKLKYINFSSGAKDMVVSPNGKEVAFLIRGDIFVTSIEYGTTRRITNTPEQERDISFSPDGKHILYSAEREGLWNIYQTSLTRKEDNSFIYAKEFKEEQLTNSKDASFQALYSPDGKEIAYLENRTTIKALTIKEKTERIILDGKFNYSYADGDQWFQWSPDSKWILTHYIGIGGWNNVDVALVKADGSGELTDLTESGYTDANPRFVQDGKAMVWFSDRAGYRSHGSWGAYMDAYIMFFDKTAYDKFNMTKEELAIIEELEKEEKKQKDAKESADKKKKDSKKKEELKKIKPLKFDLENRKDLVIRLTPNSSSLADAILNKKGDKLYYLTRFEKDYDLWVYDLKEKSSKILTKSAGSSQLQTDSLEKNIILLSKGQIKKINMETGEVKPISINSQFNYQPEKERSYIFDHVWKQIKDKFYVKDLHGVDWDMYKAAYKKFLPHINNNFDFVELLSEMLGELNGSHTGARYFNTPSPTTTATLGAFYDEDYEGNGLLVKEVIDQGPLTFANSKIKDGSLILKIDGTEIKKGEDYYPVLIGKVGKKVLITYKESVSSSEKEEWVKPISQGMQTQLLYKRWVKQRRNMVDSLSNGRIGYIHVKGMDSQSFREVYSELLGRCRNKEAVIIDTRHNGGGWLHDDLVTLLSGKEYQRFVPRDQYIGSDPYNKWTKPSAVLVCEDNYSNAHGFPWLYKELKIGKLIGTPVPGTMTAVWWENQIDPTIVFGVPQVAIKDMRGKYLENQELQPDIEVYNDPASTLQGRDLQIEKAVESLLNK